MISAISPLDDGINSLILLRCGKLVKVEMTPKECMRLYFEEHGVCYEGGRKVSCKLLNVRQKAPVSLCYSEELVFFPTHSTNNIQCGFVNVSRIRRVSTYRKKETKVEFNKNYVIFPIGIRSIKTQIKRCDFLINRKIDYGKFKIN